MRVLEKACPECGSDMELKTSRFGLFYGCVTYPKCKAKHGAHHNGKPLGIPANEDVKKLRQRCHELFDQMWKEGPITRTGAYQRLQGIMNLSAEEAHIGRFNKEQCEYLISYLENAGNQN